MVTTAYQVAGWLEKMDSPDKDFRFMAASDLLSDLQKNNLKLDEDSEKKVARKLLKLLEDKNGEIQNLTVKCLGTLVGRSRGPQADFVVDSLCTNLIAQKPELRDVSSVALKTVVTELTPNSQFASNIVGRLTPQLSKVLIENPEIDAGVRMEMLDILADVLFRFGGSISQNHLVIIKDVLLQVLPSSRQAIRKRAINCLGSLCSCCDTNIFEDVASFLLSSLKQANNDASIQTLSTAFASLTKANSARVTAHLSTVVEILLDYCHKSNDDELREAVLQTVETFILRCPREITPFIPKIESMVLEYVCHDPNYCGDSDDEGGDEDDDDDNDADFSDDDDVSWKVRRSAAKVIEALIVSRREQVLHSINAYGPLLIGRLKEREETVRLDIMRAYISLLRQISTFVPNSMSAYNTHDENSVVIGAAKFANGAFSMEQLALLTAVYNQVPSVIKAVAKLLKNKSSRTRIVSLALLSQLVRTLPGSLSNQFPGILPSVEALFVEKSTPSQMKIDAIQFFALVFKAHEHAYLLPHLRVFVSSVSRAIEDNFYKVASEGLAILDQLIPLVALKGDLDLITKLYNAALPRLKAVDLDLELKERAIIAAGLFIAYCGNQLKTHIPEMISLLIERCRNEVTRIHAIRSLEVVIKSPLKIELEPGTFDALLPLLTESLRKNQQALKISVLALLATLFKDYYYPGVNADSLVAVLGEVANLIDQDDLLVAKFALNCYALAFAKYPEATTPHLQTVISQFVKLMKAAVLQGPLLNSGLEMIESLVRNNVPGKPKFEALLDQMTAPVYDNAQLPRQAFSAISAATAVVASASQNPEDSVLLARQLSEQLANRSSTDAIRLFSLLSLGELGRRCSRVYSSDEIKAEPLIMDAFNSQNEDLKAGASYALGGMAVGNLQKFLPFILQQMHESKRQFLLLHAIKEIILCEAQAQDSYKAFQAHIGQIWQVLLAHAESAEESTRNVVSECIGKLCVLQPSLLNDLKVHMNSSSPNVRLVIVTSIKYMVSIEKRPIDEELSKMIPDFLALVHVDDLNLRRYVFNTLSCIAHSKPALIRDQLNGVMPVIYAETKVRKELIKEVEMGPFKHQVDNGLDLRKAAFECMFTLLGSCLEKLDIFEFISHLEDGLRVQDSHHDIRLLAYVNLSKLATLTPAHVMQRLDRICEHLKGQLLSKAKANAVKQDFDKHDDLKRAAIRTWLTLQEMPEASRQPQLVDINNVIRQTPELKEMLMAIEKDSQRVYYGDHSMDTS